MRFRVEPRFVHRTSEPRYFVRSLDALDDGWKCGFRWEVQLLNDDGQGAATVEFGPDDGDEFTLYLNVDLPSAVVEAARAGVNDYLDREGRRRLPAFLGGGLATDSGA
jgi:hypothetical protein